MNRNGLLFFAPYDSEGVKKLKWIYDYILLSPRFNRFLSFGKKYLTKYLICINIIQYEAIGGRESKVTEEDPRLF